MAKTNPTPPQSEREKLKTKVSIMFGHLAEGAQPNYIEQIAGRVADFILEREANLTPCLDLNNPKNQLSSVKDPIEKFNLFIKKWCLDYPHLIDSDQNDGQEIRAMLRDLLAEKTQKGEHHFVHVSTNMGEWMKNIIYCTHCGMTPKEIAALTPKTTKEDI